MFKIKTRPRSVVGGILLTLLLLSVMAMPALAAENPIPSINVNATSSVSVNPDQAVITLAVVTNDSTAQKASEKNAKLSNSVIEALLAKGISRDKIQTANFSVWPVYNYDEKRDKPQIIGYSAQNQVQVTTKDLAGVGTIIDAAITAGANQVQDVRFLKEDTAPATQEALQKACITARSKAETVAAALGLKLGRVLQINESGSYFEEPFRNLKVPAMEGMGGSMDTMTPIEPGQIKITSTVSISFAIE